MIPVLFKPTETDKRKLMKGQGLGALAEVISCKVTHTENKGYICDIEYPMYGRRAKDIVQEGIIRAKANDIDDPQLFRIKEIDTQTKPKTIILYCEHLFYDLKDNFIEHVFAEKVDIMGAGQAILDNTTRTHLFEMGDTNLTADPLVRDFTLDRCNPCDAFRGIEGSLIDTYNNGKGITIYPDNFKINIYSRIGGGGTITYKKNLVGIERKDSVLDVVTVIYPYAKVNDENNNETIITLDEKFLYAADEDLNAYVHYKILPVDLSGESIKDQDSLRSAAETYLKDIQTKPKVTYTINLAPIRKTTEYKDLKFIEGYRVGYMVNVNDKRFKLNNIPVKVNKLVYNSLTEEVEQVVLGNVTTSLGGVIDNKIADTNKTIEVIKTQFEQQFEQAVNELTDKINSGINGHTIKTENEYFVIDTLDPNTAQHVSRFNINGIAFSSNGINGPYIGLTSDGKLVINETTCKKFTAALIQAGILKSIDGCTRFDLDTGKITLYDLINDSYSIEMYDSKIDIYDRFGTSGSKKNMTVRLTSRLLKGKDFGYNLGNTADQRTAAGLYSGYGQALEIGFIDDTGKYCPCMVIEGAQAANINQGQRLGMHQDMAILNGKKIYFYGSLHNFIGQIAFDADSKMNIWGTGGHILTVGTKNIMTTSETGVTVYGVFTDSSDLAFKTNVQPLEKDTLQIVKDINIYEYEENGTTEIGLLAQQAIEVIPDIIKGTPTDTTIEEANTMTEEERKEKLKDGGASVDVYSMLSILWDANKKLIDKVERLENKIEELENKIK